MIRVCINCMRYISIVSVMKTLVFITPSINIIKIFTYLLFTVLKNNNKKISWKKKTYNNIKKEICKIIVKYYNNKRNKKIKIALDKKTAYILYYLLVSFLPRWNFFCYFSKIYF